MAFVHSGFAQFVASRTRLLRTTAGLVLIGLGLLADNMILTAVGLSPLAAGAFDVCLLASGLAGAKIRAAVNFGKGAKL